jgi:hypothetical protein
MDLNLEHDVYIEECDICLKTESGIAITNNDGDPIFICKWCLFEMVGIVSENDMDIPNNDDSDEYDTEYKEN